MAQKATTSLSLHYQVKPGQREAVLAEIKGILDLCAKEPEFITAIIHETPDRPNEFVFYELWNGKERARSLTPYRGRSLTAKPIWGV
jgi:quinol monooxygenase YgiN